MSPLEERVEKLAYRVYQNSIYDPAIDFHDLAQIGHLQVLKCKKHYSEEYGASFETFALMAARTTMIDVARGAKKYSKNVELKESTYDPMVEPSDSFMLMVDQLRSGVLSPLATKLLEGTIRVACELDKCTLRELRRYLGMTPHEFSMARMELMDRMCEVCL